MSNRLYVGNLSYTTTEEVLRSAFSEYGQVVNASVVLDRMTGRSRGFGFVEMSNDNEAQQATQSMNGAMLDGRPLVVNEARERTEGGEGRGPGGPRRGGSGMGGGPRRGGPGGGGGWGGPRGGGRGDR